MALWRYAMRLPDGTREENVLAAKREVWGVHPPAFWR